jgi:hypothetical protein
MPWSALSQQACRAALESEVALAGVQLQLHTDKPFIFHLRQTERFTSHNEAKIPIESHGAHSGRTPYEAGIRAFRVRDAAFGKRGTYPAVSPFVPYGHAANSPGLPPLPLILIATDCAHAYEMIVLVGPDMQSIDIRIAAIDAATWGQARAQHLVAKWPGISNGKASELQSIKHMPS